MVTAPLLNALNIILGERQLKLLSWVSKDHLSLNDCWANLGELLKDEDIEKTKVSFNIDKEYDRLITLGIRLITQEDNEYPNYLKEIPFAPLGIYLKGNPLPKENTLNLAIVGTRKLSRYGETIIKKFMPLLAQNKLNIISGLALGTDACAHQEALNNNGNTIAVLGSGLDNIAPRTNIYLANKIGIKGTLVSELPLETPPLAQHFPLRNRIISGLSRAVLVIEAPFKSGSLITTKYAIDQNRDVLAIPGPVFNHNTEGSNDLISKGATLISKAEDVLESFNIKDPSFNKYPPVNLSLEEAIIIEVLKANDSIHVDKIAALAKLRPDSVLGVTTLLELKGLIINKGSGYFALNKT
jgi:DNA processing protein